MATSDWEICNYPWMTIAYDMYKSLYYILDIYNYKEMKEAFDESADMWAAWKHVTPEEFRARECPGIEQRSIA